MAHAKLALSLLAFALISTTANAALLFEPYAGYSVGTLSTTTTASVNDSGSLNGLAYGGRAGFLLHHFVVVSGEYQAIAAKEKLGSTTTQYDWNSATIFATLGFQAPGGFRLMGSYGFDSKAKETTTPDSTTYKGTAAKLLIGWHLPTNMALNLEYTIFHYTDKTVLTTTSKLNDSYTKFDSSSVMATVSFPFELFGGSGGHSSSSGQKSRGN